MAAGATGGDGDLERLRQDARLSDQMATRDSIDVQEWVSQNIGDEIGVRDPRDGAVYTARVLGFSTEEECYGAPVVRTPKAMRFGKLHSEIVAVPERYAVSPQEVGSDV